jgi:hypothetical protein
MMIDEEVAHGCARLMTLYPNDERRHLDDVPLDLDACLWLLRIPQTGCALLENWEAAISTAASLRWISQPFLTNDEMGCPELQLLIAPSERRAVLRLVSIIRGELGIPFLFGPAVSKWEAESRGFAPRNEARQCDGGGV